MADLYDTLVTKGQRIVEQGGVIDLVLQTEVLAAGFDLTAFERDVEKAVEAQLELDI